MEINKVWKSYSIQLLFALYLLVAIVASLQDLLHAQKAYLPNGLFYFEYNNYIIFKNSYFHLIEGKDLYRLFPAEQWDLYKYSPAFSLFFSLFAYFPDYIGLVLWSLLNALLVFFAILQLPAFSPQKKSWMLLFCAIELLGSIQNAQSNGLMAGLIIMAFALMEQKRYGWAAFCIVFSVYIKIFGAAAFALCLLYPSKTRMATYIIFWMLFLAIIPALAAGFSQLGILYQHWFRLLQDDHMVSQGLSLVGVLNAWFRVNVSKNEVAIAGILIFCIPLLRWKYYSIYSFRLLMLSSVLLWTIVFNHKAESPTFIISMCGIAIWYFAKSRTRGDRFLLLLSFVLTTLSVSDLCPRFVREEFIRPYRIKALMSVVIWIKVVIELMFEKFSAGDFQPKMSTDIELR